MCSWNVACWLLTSNWYTYCYCDHTLTSLLFKTYEYKILLANIPDLNCLRLTLRLYYIAAVHSWGTSFHPAGGIYGNVIYFSWTFLVWVARLSFTLWIVTWSARVFTRLRSHSEYLTLWAILVTAQRPRMNGQMQQNRHTDAAVSDKRKSQANSERKS